jgi:hypothetical protein
MYKSTKAKKSGVALIVCMIFLAIFSALAVGVASMADNNAQLARNQHQGSLAFTGAQSGLEIMRYWVGGIEVSDDPNPQVKMQRVYSILHNKLAAAGVENISTGYDGSSNTVTIPIVALDAASGQNFGVVFSLSDVNTLQMQITGGGGQASKKVAVNFDFVTLGSGVFSYGVATKGPLSLSGQADIGSTDLAIYASVYIDGLDTVSGDLLTMTTKTAIAGDVSIAKENATYSVSGSIGGANGSNVDDHIHMGVPPVSFPTPNPEHFLQYATGPEIPSGTTASHGTFDNCIIRAGSTVHFADDATINGVLYIESGANVNFDGKVTVNGIIAGDGPINNEDGISNLKFAGQVVSNDASTLTGSQFDDIKKETGTFICAPGFQLNFSGQAFQVNGAVAANGISFSGQSGGTINGSILDYSKYTMTMVGQSSLTFNRSGRDAIPAGFEPVQRLDFAPNSYSESL